MTEIMNRPMPAMTVGRPDVATGSFKLAKTATMATGTSKMPAYPAALPPDVVMVSFAATSNQKIRPTKTAMTGMGSTIMAAPMAAASPNVAMASSEPVSRNATTAIETTLTLAAMSASGLDAAMASDMKVRTVTTVIKMMMISVATTADRLAVAMELPATTSKKAKSAMRPAMMVIGSMGTTAPTTACRRPVAMVFEHFLRNAMMAMMWMVTTAPMPAAKLVVAMEF